MSPFLAPTRQDAADDPPYWKNGGAGKREQAERSQHLVARYRRVNKEKNG
jgi:hypothetical protein